MAREDHPGQKQLVAYVVPEADLQPAKKEEAGDTLTAERLAQWAVTFDEAYRQGGTGEDATFNIAGWNSSYTGKPIPPEEMRVWVETTVDRILALNPKSVWEIGCGTGLLLFRIAPKTDFFRGTAVSQAAGTKRRTTGVTTREVYQSLLMAAPNSSPRPGNTLSI